MSTFNQYTGLLRILIRNTLSFNKAQKDKQKNKQVAAKIGIAFAILMIGLYAAVMTGFIADSLAGRGMLGDFLYTILFGAQFIVLFFGAAAIMSYMFFSKDNALLASLPLNPRAVFLAKFTMAYISELFFSALITLPTLTTIGVLSFIRGYGLAWHFFLVEAVSVFLLPVIPLLLVSLLSMPLMYFISFLKRRAVGNGIAMAVLYIGVMAVYLAVVLGFSSTAATSGNEGGMVIPETALAAFGIIKKATIYNYSLVQAFMNNNTALNLFIYAAGIVVVMFIALGVVSVFYRRALSVLSEGLGASSKQKKKQKEIETSTLFRSFLQKEVRTLLHTPILLMGTIASVILLPVIMFFMSSTMSLGVEEMPNDMMTVAYITFLAYILSSGTNQIAVIGFSREGKNLYVLKSLPISAKTIVNAKLFFAMCVTVLAAVMAAVFFPIATGNRSVFAIIGLPLTVLCGGFAMNCVGLLNDLKNPNLTWNNVNELTRNNKRMIKPMLISFAFGFSQMIVGMILGFTDVLKGEVLYLSYYAFCVIPLIILAIIAYKRLYAAPETYLERLEG